MVPSQKDSVSEVRFISTQTYPSSLKLTLWVKFNHYELVEFIFP